LVRFFKLLLCLNFKMEFQVITCLKQKLLINSFFGGWFVLLLADANLNTDIDSSLQSPVEFVFNY
jgi:hypothetical protein